MSDDAQRATPGFDPDDLDISKSEYVRELGDDRYVVSAGDRPPRAPRERGHDAAEPADAGDASSGSAPEEGLPDPDAVRAGEMDAGPTTGGASPDRTRPAAGGSPDVPPDPPPEGPTGRPSGAEAAPPDADPPDDGAGRGRPASHGRRGAPRGGAGGATGDDSDGAARSADALDAGAVGQWLAASLAETRFAYGFDATLSVDGRTARHRMASDDVVETFETLVAWFAAAAAGDDAGPEEALGILLAGMDTAPRIPPNAVRAGLADLGLSRGDSIEELLAALDREGGLRLK